MGLPRNGKMKETKNTIVIYYSGQAPDDEGRYLAEIQAWPDDRLEACHDFIQWMFPLRERSGVNSGAPTLDDATINEFRSRPELQKRLRSSFIRMLSFYGFEIQSAPLRVTRAPDFQERAKNWLSPWNHNHLRITRILKSMTLLGLEEEARAFFECLSCVYRAQGGGNASVSAETFLYWQSALSAR
jgi:Opioid growth factor receptor (OGFr) conserved region